MTQFNSFAYFKKSTLHVHYSLLFNAFSAALDKCSELLNSDVAANYLLNPRQIRRDHGVNPGTVPPRTTVPPTNHANQVEVP